MGGELFNKNIFLISPRYFNYEKEIQTALENRGAFVHFIDDRIKNTTLNKALFRLKLKEKIGQQSVLGYFKKQLDENKHLKIDYLIAIIPEGFSKQIIEYYRTQLPDTIFILYMWDSIGNRPYIIETLNLYDKTFTFDKSDSDRYGLKFRPLFYTDDYREIGMAKPDENEQTYDFSFIGTAHSDRYATIKKLISTTGRTLNNFLFFYLQHPSLIAYYWLTDPMFRKVKAKDISFKSMAKHEVLSVMRRSFCIIDINHPKQTGLTIRTLEVLGAKRKLITTNADIKNYDFFNSKNILLIDRTDPKLDEAFLSGPYEEISESIYNKYSITNWIDDIFNR